MLWALVCLQTSPSTINLRDKRSKAEVLLERLVACCLFSEGKQNIALIKRKYWLRQGALLQWGKNQQFSVMFWKKQFYTCGLLSLLANTKMLANKTFCFSWASWSNNKGIFDLQMLSESFSIGALMFFWLKCSVADL